MLDQINITLMEKTTNYLMPAIITAESSSRLVEEGALNLRNKTQLEAYALGVLKPLPQLNAFYIGDKFGNFIMTKRLPDQTIQTKVIQRQGTHTVTLKSRNQFGQVISTQKEKDLSYDPRVRPWYIGAKEFEQRYWTDVYLFYTGKKPGITAAYPAFDKSRQFYGVFGVDIQLEHIANLLQSDKLSADSEILIINDKNKVVAYPQAKQRKLNNSDLLDPLHISELESEVINSAFQEHEELQQNKFLFSHNNRQYLGSFQAFPEYFGKKWRIVMIVPVDSLVQTKLNTNKSLYTTLGISLLFVLLLSWVVSRKQKH